MNKKPLRVGMLGFGRTGRAVATVLFNAPQTHLEWVVRRSMSSRHHSVAEVLGVESPHPAPFHTIDEMDAGALLDRFPVDAIVDFSGEDGVLYYGEAAASRGITIISAISGMKDTAASVRSLAALAARESTSPAASAVSTSSGTRAGTGVGLSSSKRA